MKIFGFIFYKVYNFYNKRWPKHDPEIYAGLVTMFIIIFTLMFATYATCEFFYIKIKHINLYYFPLLITTIILYYHIFFKNDRYLSFLKEENYKSKFYQSSQVTVAVILLILLPIFFLIAFILLIAKHR